ncbi:MAG: hypothetical protein ACTHJT_00640 [Cytophaga sp.]|uniref:hypothetical protein n=1 Tax=Cytophaga sp. TaxID=29535 RepID=UPI003F7E543D
MNKAELIGKLHTIVYTDKLPLLNLTFSLDFKGKPFFGKINSDTFDIMPVIEGRNSFAPVMKGEITGENPSRVLIKMRLHIAVIIFLTLITLFILATAISNPQNGGLVILPIIYLFVIYMYVKESNKYRRKIEDELSSSEFVITKPR